MPYAEAPVRDERGKTTMASTINEQIAITTEATEEEPPIAAEKSQRRRPLYHLLLMSFASVSPAYLFSTAFPPEVLAPDRWVSRIADSGEIK
jgi:hypothetical protein